MEAYIKAQIDIVKDRIIIMKRLMVENPKDNKYYFGKASAFYEELKDLEFLLTKV